MALYVPLPAPASLLAQSRHPRNTQDDERGAQSGQPAVPARQAAPQLRCDGLKRDDQDLDDGLSATLRRAGYAFVPAAQTRALAERLSALSDWEAFAASWNDLHLDTHMADGGRYRKRRHAVFRVAADGTIERQPHQPHYQGVDYNPLNGGVQRWFEPVTEAVGNSACLHSLLGLCRSVFGALSPAAAAWKVEMHQFRIEARPGEAGQPTPEGPHRDGVDWVLVLLVNRRNIEQGTTVVYDLQHRELGCFTLTLPFDAAFVEDARVYHGVTAVTPLDPAAPAYRDVLVLTFRAVP